MASPHGLSLQVTIQISTERIDEFFKLFKPMYESVIAEPECRFFEVYQSPEDPGTISWAEHWDCSVEYLMTTQLNKQYYKDYIAVAEKMFLKPREAVIANRVGPPYSIWKDATA